MRRIPQEPTGQIYKKTVFFLAQLKEGRSRSVINFTSWIQDLDCLFRETHENDVYIDITKSKISKISIYSYEEKRVENQNPQISISGSV